jgi:hypothetical protein
VRLASFAEGAAVALALLFAPGCAAAIDSSKAEDRARRTVPVPICLKSLPRHGKVGVVSTLTPDDYWTLLLPAYDTEAQTLDPNAADCSGRPLLSDPSLAEAEGTRSSLAVKPEDHTVVKGPDGFQVVWLRSHRFADGTFAGPIALLRPKEAYAEAYAIGLYRGTPATSHFAYQRLGPDILVTAANEACAGAPAGQGCESTVVLYLARDGSLSPAGEFSLDRVKYGTAPAVAGTVQQRLTSTPKYKAKSVIVTEQLVLRDSSQNEIRRATLDRTFTLKNGKLVSDVESLWAQVSPPAAPAAPPPPPPPASAAPPVAPKPPAHR